MPAAPADQLGLFNQASLDPNLQSVIDALRLVKPDELSARPHWIWSTNGITNSKVRPHQTQDHP